MIRVPFAGLVPAVLALAVACRAGPPPPPPAGEVRPTVAGAPAASYANLEEARAAFTRSAGSLTATLEDAAWLRFLGDPSRVEREHRAYFEYGYTTFLVELRSETFTQPTNEDFVLEDSGGKSLHGRPIEFRGSNVLVDDRFFSTFSLSFPHVITADVRWVRLVRAADGSAVEWTFPGRDAAPGEGGPFAR